MARPTRSSRRRSDTTGPTSNNGLSSKPGARRQSVPTSPDRWLPKSQETVPRSLRDAAPVLGRARLRNHAPNGPRQSAPHGEQAIYDGSQLLGVATWRAGFSHARLATGRSLGKFIRPNDAMKAIGAASSKLDEAAS
jgi:hypothetical protein